jgi:hypothetical protein
MAGISDALNMAEKGTCHSPMPLMRSKGSSSPWCKSRYIRRAMHPRWLRGSSLAYGPIFSVVAPCHRGASPVSVSRGTCTAGC